MELCKDVMTGLSLLKDKTRVSKVGVIQLVKIISELLISNPGSTLDKDLDSAELKLIGLSIASVYLETAKINKSLNEEISLIEMSLSDASVDPDFVQPIIDQYKVIEKQLKGKLVKIKIDGNMKSSVLSELIDTRWRQDVIIKSKNRNQINEIKYLIDLSTNNGKQISFSTDLPGLQDLSYHLKDCCKVIENTFKNVI